MQAAKKKQQVDVHLPAGDSSSEASVEDACCLSAVCCVGKGDTPCFLYLFYWNVFSSCVSFALVMPSLWPYLHSMGGSEQFMSWCVAIYSLGELLGSIMIGSAYNCFGAKPTLLFSIVCGLSGSLLYACAGLFKWPWMVLAGRFLQGAWTGGEQSVESAFIAENVLMSKRTQIMTTLQSFACAGFILGPAIGTPLESFSLTIGPLLFDENMVPGLFIASVGLVMLLLTSALFQPAAARMAVSSNSANANVKNAAADCKEDDVSYQTLSLSDLLARVRSVRLSRDSSTTPPIALSKSDDASKMQFAGSSQIRKESNGNLTMRNTTTVQTTENNDTFIEMQTPEKATDKTPLLARSGVNATVDATGAMQPLPGTVPGSESRSYSGECAKNGAAEYSHSFEFCDDQLLANASENMAHWQSPSLAGTGLCLLAFFVHFEGFAVQETMTTVLVQTEFGWTEADANLLFTAAGFLSLFALVVLWWLSSRNTPLSDWTLIVLSLLIGAIGHLSLINWPFFGGYNSYQFLFGFALITVAFPVGRSCVLSLYSKVVGPLPQGTYMGVIFVFGAISRIVAPLCSVRLFEENGPTLLFAVSGCLFAASLLLFTVLRTAVKPHSQLEMFEALINELMQADAQKLAAAQKQIRRSANLRILDEKLPRGFAKRLRLSIDERVDDKDASATVIRSDKIWAEDFEAQPRLTRTTSLPVRYGVKTKSGKVLCKPLKPEQFVTFSPGFSPVASMRTNL